MGGIDLTPEASFAGNTVVVLDINLTEKYYIV